MSDGPVRFPFVLASIEDVTNRLVTAYNPERVILFGSHATGTARSESDVDLIVLKETDERPVDRRVRVESLLVDSALPLDILVYTPAEFRYLFAIGSPFIEEVIATGRVLYMRRAAESWCAEAADELSSAHILFEHDHFKGACYHSQQCVEKALKALIVEKGERPERVHDLVSLAASARRLGWPVELSVDDAVLLNSIYKGRYPTEDGLLPYGEPTRADAERATAAADAVFRALPS
jgi:HEPN domain-containing protein/predicted nucleotidyltransferase